MATRHKISRKELKQPDEFQSVFETAALFFELHVVEVLLAVGAVVIVAIVVLGVIYHENSRASAAAARFDQAMSELDGGQYPAAERDLSSLAADEPHRAVGRLANLYLGNAYLAQKQPAKARDAFERYLAADDNAIFRGAALDDLAVAYEELGDYQKAEQTYRRAAGIEGPEQGRAQLGVARMLEKRGKRAEAVAAYRDFLGQHPFAPERTLVMGALAALGVAPDASPPPPAIRVIKPAAVH